jgi:hypothetical protein
MILWILLITVVTWLSYFSDIGLLGFMKEWKVPILDASIVSVLLLLCVIGLLTRMLRLQREGEKEALRARIKELEKELSELKNQ